LLKVALMKAIALVTFRLVLRLLFDASLLTCCFAIIEN